MSTGPFLWENDIEYRLIVSKGTELLGKYMKYVFDKKKI